MKKLVILGFLFGLAYSVQAGERPREKSISFTLNSDNSLYKRVAADFLWRPKNIVWGVSANNSRISGRSKNAPQIEALDISGIVGYWSNKEKKRLLGWHVYVGTGFSSVDVQSKEYEYRHSIVQNGKCGVGFDVYLFRSPRKSLALTAEIMAVSQLVELKSKTDGAVYKASGYGQLSNQVGLRLWF